MGAWGENAFETDAALDLMGRLGDSMRESDGPKRGIPVLRLVSFALTTRDTEEFHAACELLAAVLSDDWYDYRVGGGSGIFGKMAGESDARVWLPDSALALVQPMREGLDSMGTSGVADFRRDVQAIASRLGDMASTVRGTNPDRWDDEKTKAAALDATAARILSVLG